MAYIELGVCLTPAITAVQWTVTYTVDDQQAVQALGEERVPHMKAALDRVKASLERVLAGSTGAVTFAVAWTAPDSATAIAEAVVVSYAVQSAAVARDKLANQAETDGEPQAEINLYDALPTPTIPFHYDGDTVESVSSVAIPSALNRHLQLQAPGGGNDGDIRFRPPSSTLKWQFWKGKLRDGHALFEASAIHESLHLLGFTSFADSVTLPTSLTSWDLFRIPESSVPVNAAQFAAVARELRPTTEASWITRLGTTLGAYKASRGARTGGDGFNASHWRSMTRLEPPQPIGVMDPSSVSGDIYAMLGQMLLSRADAEALDLMGWNVNPNALVLGAGDEIELLTPAVAHAARPRRDLEFAWHTTSSTPDGWA
ncbi:MAG: NF038122 family metalloprotease, partial [Phycisphaerales bacterium]|nr:NF038122 family metalloprotease [Phycisphaerales bacterium]